MFDPKHVTVVGASNRASNAGVSFVRALHAAGFSGTLSVVNRDGADVEGATGAVDFGGLPGVPDLAILAVPASLTAQTLSDAAEAGVKTVHAFAGGFGELGTDEGTRAEERLRELADEAGIALLGPNCMGLYRPRAGLAFREDQPMLDGPIGIVSQSGGVVINAAHRLASAGIGIATGVSFGNGAQYGAGTWSERISATGELSALGVYIESANEPDLTDRLAAAAQRQPVVLYVGPRGARAEAAAQRHTGARGGTDIPTEWPEGVLTAHDFEHFLDALSWYSQHPIPARPPRIAVVTISGGVGIMATSTLDAHGVPLAEVAAETRQAIRDVAGSDLVRPENPVDLGPRYLSRKLAAGTLAALRNDAGVDLIVFHLVWDHLIDVDRRNPGYADGYLDLIRDRAAGAADLCLYFPRVLDSEAERAARDDLRRQGVTVFETWDALARLAAISTQTVASSKAVT